MPRASARWPPLLSSQQSLVAKIHAWARIQCLSARRLNRSRGDGCARSNISQWSMEAPKAPVGNIPGVHRVTIGERVLVADVKRPRGQFLSRPKRLRKSAHCWFGKTTSGLRDHLQSWRCGRIPRGHSKDGPSLPWQGHSVTLQLARACPVSWAFNHSIIKAATRVPIAHLSDRRRGDD
jgi:hypothetical protein